MLCIFMHFYFTIIIRKKVTALKYITPYNKIIEYYNKKLERFNFNNIQNDLRLNI